MASKMGATMSLIALVVGICGSGYVLDRLPSPTALFATTTGPKFKVEYGDFMEERPTQCGRNLCPFERVPVRRLKVQSLNEQPITITNVVINDNDDCSTNPIAKIAKALKAEGRDPGLLSQLPDQSKYVSTLKYGDVANVPTFGCEPVKVRIVTDRGEKTYDLE